MTAPLPPERGPYPGEREPGPNHPVVEASQLWPGGVATAVVAALIALVGVLVARWLFNISLLSPRKDGAYGDVHTTAFVLVAAVAALVATGLLYLLLVSTPRPTLFFSWIVGLITVVLTVYPFSTGAPISQKVATAAVDLILGIAIGSLLNGVAARSVRRTRGRYTTTVVQDERTGIDPRY